jgi:hypothetical protein
MGKRNSRIGSVGIVAGLVFVSLGVTSVAPVRAQNFFQSLFGGLSSEPSVQPQPRIEPFVRRSLPPDDTRRYEAPRARSHAEGSSSGVAWCVRTCDGRYFPAQGDDSQSRAQSCNSFCPAAQTAVVYGSDIDDATTASGKAYSDLPNAFRYRNEIVAGCTCNGKDTVGLAQVQVKDDPTLRKGDIVANPDGLVVASRNAEDRRGVAMNFSPLPDAVRARFRHVPVVARE